MYEITTDPTGSNYICLTIQWEYGKGYVDIFMPHYIEKLLKQFLHTLPTRQQHVLHRWREPAYVQKFQYALPESILTILDKSSFKRIQSINGTLFYYARPVYPCMLPAINEISSQQAYPIEEINAKVKMLMDYSYTYPDATIHYHASDMQLYIDSYAAYLVFPKACIHSAGHFYFRNKFKNTTQIPTPRNNGPVLIEYVALRNVMLLETEAEVGTVHHNGKIAIPVRTAVIKMGHLQGPTPIKTDNSTAD